MLTVSLLWQLAKDFFHCNILLVILWLLDQLEENGRCNHNIIHNILYSMMWLLILLFVAMDLLDDKQSETYNSQTNLQWNMNLNYWSVYYLNGMGLLYSFLVFKFEYFLKCILFLYKAKQLSILLSHKELFSFKKLFQLGKDTREETTNQILFLLTKH